MKIHTVKIWPDYFNAVKSKIKTFEIRENDRDYKPGDVIIMREWDPKTRKYTGRKSRHGIGWISPVGDGYVVFSLLTPTLRQISPIEGGAK
jgi:hypothetical protein